jgi:GAF domain-containing protein
LPLPFAPNELNALADWAEAHRPERLDEIRALAAAGVGLAVPLRTRTEILGVLLLGGRPQRAGFSAHEKQVLRACADQFALMIENARLTDRVVEQETLRRDIALASDVQRRLLPDARRGANSPISPRSASRPAASAATTTISSSCATARSASRWPTCRAKASPPPYHVRGAGVAADHFVRGRRGAATTGRANE